MRIDSHQHFWRYSPDSHAWINDDMAKIQRDFLPADLEPLLKANRIDGCVLVQVQQNEEENKFFLGLAEQNPFIMGVVGWVDLEAPDLDEKLATYRADYPKLKGFRHILQGESDPNHALRPKFQEGVAKLGEYGFTYDILVYPHQLPAAIELVRNCPGTMFVLDHMGKPRLRDHDISDWAIPFESIGAHPNAYCKLSGLVTECDWNNWRASDIEYFFRRSIDGFGPWKIMFGSDWPVCLVAAEYKQIVDMIENAFANYLSQSEMDYVMGKAAQKFYKLEGHEKIRGPFISDWIDEQGNWIVDE
jgi:L-fuconolactonase